LKRSDALRDQTGERFSDDLLAKEIRMRFPSLIKATSTVKTAFPA